MPREKPKDGNWYGWDVFEKWADENGIGDHFDDWDTWWECWKSGYSAAMNSE